MTPVYLDYSHKFLKPTMGRIFLLISVCLNFGFQTIKGQENITPPTSLFSLSVTSDEIIAAILDWKNTYSPFLPNPPILGFSHLALDSRYSLIPIFYPKLSKDWGLDPKKFGVHFFSSPEELKNLKGDELVVLSPYNHPKWVQHFKNMGIKPYILDPLNSYGDLFKHSEIIAKHLLGNEASLFLIPMINKYETLFKNAEIIKQNLSDRQRMLLVWSPTYFFSGANTFQTSVIETAGFISISARFGPKGWFRLDTEALRELSPTWIVLESSDENCNATINEFWRQPIINGWLDFRKEQTKLVCLSSSQLSSQSLFALEVTATLQQNLLNATFQPSVSEDKMQNTTKGSNLFWRLFVGFCVGALLSLGGVITQGYFLNPLACPFTLGTGSGAQLGILLAVFFFETSTQWYSVPLGSLVGALISAWILFTVCRRKKIEGFNLLVMGLSLGGIMSAGAGLLQSLSMSNPMKFQQISQWFQASFSGKSWEHGLLVGSGLLMMLLLAIGLGAKLDVLSLGHENAKALGISTKKLENQVLLLLTLSVASSTAACGFVPFMGLMTPHLCRRLLSFSKNNNQFLFLRGNRPLIILAPIIGGVLTIFFDILTRFIFYPLDIPVGGVVSLMGSIFLLSLYIWGKPR